MGLFNAKRGLFEKEFVKASHGSFTIAAPMATQLNSSVKVFKSRCVKIALLRVLLYEKLLSRLSWMYLCSKFILMLALNQLLLAT